MKEWSFEIAGQRLAGKRWGTEGGTPILALHGWLDNCASFDFLAPQLQNADIVALDLPGHGLSDHRQGLCAYNIWQDTAIIMALAKKLGWQRFGLLGHSRGAMISLLIAGSFPKQVTHLGLIESFTPQFIDDSEAPQQLAAAVVGLLNLRDQSSNTYETFERAVKAREKGFVPLVHADALVLAKRGVVTLNDGMAFQWAYDRALTVASEVKFTLAQVKAFVQNIVVPFKLILATEGMLVDLPVLDELINVSDKIAVHRVAGKHHLHMSEQCDSLAELLSPYFQQDFTKAE
ncbi:MAG: alpha/beta hydrolase [Alteromonadaceae bacterium]|nr:MAG: alpha/beta hydrolase [Alteromonadaceae bacterium]